MPRYLKCSQLRQVQSLADFFWKRWTLEYLATLEPWREWTTEKPDLPEGDIGLIKDTQTKRNEWCDSKGHYYLRHQSPKGYGENQGVLKEYLKLISDVVLLITKVKE